MCDDDFSYFLFLLQSTPIPKKHFDGNVGYVFKDMQSSKIFYCRFNDAQRKIIVDIRESRMYRNKFFYRDKE